MDDGLLDIEYLVFSSHKTATQTVKHSLIASGINCLHAHNVGDIGLEKNQINAYLADYRKKNYRKLKIISVFRDPLERMMSSFFQALSVDAYAWVGTKLVDKDIESIVLSMTYGELTNLFCRYCEIIDGAGESILILSQEIGIGVDKLIYLSEKLISNNE